MLHYLMYYYYCYYYYSAACHPIANMLMSHPYTVKAASLVF